MANIDILNMSMERSAHKQGSQYGKKHAAASTVRHQTSAEQQHTEQVALRAMG